MAVFFIQCVILRDSQFGLDNLAYGWDCHGLPLSKQGRQNWLSTSQAKYTTTFYNPTPEEKRKGSGFSAFMALFPGNYAQSHKNRT